MGGVLTSKYAFTLIELLAIIVILAIIAVITVPIILNVIDNAKKGSIIDSAYGYKDAISKYYVEKLSDDSSFKFTDGTYFVSELKGIGVSVTGTNPTLDSWVQIVGNQVVDYSLKFDEWVANYDKDTKQTTATKGDVRLTPEAQAELDDINRIKQIVKSYLDSALEQESSLTEDTVLNISEITGVTKPTDMDDNSWIYFKKTDSGVVINDYSIKVENYVVDYSSTETDNMTVTKGETIRNKPIPRIIFNSVTDTENEITVNYYNTAWIGANPVYYNPVKGGLCDRTSDDINGTYTDSNSYNDFKGTDTNGCMKWYAYSENQDGTINMILDHNTTATVAWVSSSDYDKLYEAEKGAKSLGITYPNNTIVGSDDYGDSGNWNKGPITLLNRLKEDTKDWLGVPDRRDTYTNSNSYGNSGIARKIFTINYSGYKARIITVNEIAHITGASKATTNGGIGWSESTSGNSYRFDGLKYNESPTCKPGNTTGCSYGWLYDRTSTSCTDRGCLNNANSLTRGYWTSSPVTSLYPSAWTVSLYGNIDYDNVSSASYRFGLRPVITIPKSDAFGS